MWRLCRRLHCLFLLLTQRSQIGNHLEAVIGAFSTDISPDDLRGDALPYFLEWLNEKVILAEITAFSDADTIFEIMNDHGLSLTPPDMLKGYLLADITDDDSLARRVTPGSTRWQGRGR